MLVGGRGAIVGRPARKGSCAAAGAHLQRPLPQAHQQHCAGGFQAVARLGMGSHGLGWRPA
jgi:hypothetical protein